MLPFFTFAEPSNIVCSNRCANRYGLFFGTCADVVNHVNGNYRNRGVAREHDAIPFEIWNTRRYVEIRFSRRAATKQQGDDRSS